MMRYFFALLVLVFWSCTDADPKSYTFLFESNAEVGYTRPKASVFMEEHANGYLDLTLKMEGTQAGEEYVVRVYPGNQTQWDTMALYQWPNTLAGDTTLEAVLTLDKPFDVVREMEGLFVAHDPNKPLQLTNDSSFMIKAPFGKDQ